jgi:putative aldouronate transport system permease protein
MQNDLNLSVSEILNTYVYKLGMKNSQYSISTAVSLFNNLINCTLLVVINQITKRLSENSLW